MQVALCVNQYVPQQREVMKTVLVVKKTRQSIVAALHNVLRDIRKVNSRESGHGAIAAAFGMKRDQPRLIVGVRLLPADGSEVNLPRYTRAAAFLGDD